MKIFYVDIYSVLQIQTRPINLFELCVHTIFCWCGFKQNKYNLVQI